MRWERDGRDMGRSRRRRHLCELEEEVQVVLVLKRLDELYDKRVFRVGEEVREGHGRKEEIWGDGAPGR